jgi:hypothetical protein
MDKRRVDALEAKIRQTAGKNEYPPIGICPNGYNAQAMIADWRAGLLKQGYPLEKVNATPAYIEEC